MSDFIPGQTLREAATTQRWRDHWRVFAQAKLADLEAENHGEVDEEVVAYRLQITLLDEIERRDA